MTDQDKSVDFKCLKIDHFKKIVYFLVEDF